MAKAAAKVIVDEFDLREVFVFSGIALIVVGVRDFYPPAAWAIAGAMVFYLGIRRRD